MIQDNAAAGGVVPMFNAQKTIGATLASIRRQTYQALDIVVLDDGSTDGSASIVTAYAEKDQRIRLLRQPNGGVATARNLGAAATAAGFLSFTDADDLWAPSKIALRMDFHRRSMEGLAKQIYFYMRGHSAALLAQHGRAGKLSNGSRFGISEEFAGDYVGSAPLRTVSFGRKSPAISSVLLFHLRTRRR